MMHQLKKIFPSFTYYEPHTTYSDGFSWFTTNDHEIFGIRTSELSEKDRALLSTFVRPYNQALPPKTRKEKKWYDRIQKRVVDSPEHPYRFVYFTMQKNQIDPTAFKEAIAELFASSLPVLWESETSGIIIEDIPFPEQKINYEQIIDIFMADLSVDIKFYVGDIQTTFHHIDHYYATILEIGQTMFERTNKKVIHYIESLPYLLLHQLDEETKKHLTTSVLKHFYDDEEMLHTIDMLLEHNLNVSETAKKMYMHRNSLQYRIDKFSTETGINLQRFDEAVVVKLALLTKNNMSN